MMRAAETCSFYWVCFNNSCMLMDCVLIISSVIVGDLSPTHITTF